MATHIENKREITIFTENGCDTIANVIMVYRYKTAGYLPYGIIDYNNIFKA